VYYGFVIPKNKCVKKKAYVGADGADFAAANEHSIQLICGTTREAAMDIWRAILQVAAANQIEFEKVESAPCNKVTLRHYGRQ
jgi:hypothetical protein